MSVNFPKACGPRNHTWLRLCLTLRVMSLSINLSKACGSGSQTWLRFCLILRMISLSINLPKACGPGNQAWLRFCLILRRMSLSINCCEILKYSQVYESYRSIVGQERCRTHKDLNERRKIKSNLNQINPNLV